MSHIVSASTRNRLLKELKSAAGGTRDTSGGPAPSDDDSYVSLGLRDESNLSEWLAVLRGPENTPYHGGAFKVRLSVPSSYPLSPPKATFLTPVFHPNVHFGTGEICLDILKNEWSPAWTLMSVCQAIVALLSDPAGDSPLNCDAGNLVRSGDMRAYHSLARMYTIDAAR
jgi:peroxin-4